MTRDRLASLPAARPIAPEDHIRSPELMLPALRSMKRSVVGLADRAGTAKVHLRALMDARAALRSIEAVRGKTAPRLTRESNDYARQVLGWIGYAPWLHVYAAVAGEFREGWLPDNYWSTAVAPKVNGPYIRMSRLRSSTGLVFASGVFPDLLFLVNGLILDDRKIPLSPSDAIALLRSRSEFLVFKPDSGGWGHGLRFLDSRRLDADELRRLGNGVLQARVRQHPFFDAYKVPSLATVRIITVVADDGKPSARGCYLRLGRAGQTHVLARDQVRAAVDPGTGQVAGEGFLADWRPVDRHPDTRQPFGGTIPRFNECIRTVLSLHSSIPHTRALSWDVVVDEDDNVRVLEWEAAVVTFAEATQGPCFDGLGWQRLHLDEPRMRSE